MNSYFQPVPESLYKCGPAMHHDFDEIYEILSHEFQNLSHHPMNNLHANLALNLEPCQFDIMMNDRKNLSNLVKFLPWVLQRANVRLNDALSKKTLVRHGSAIVSVHVRRTDYRYLTRSIKRNLLSACYYEQAMHYFRQR